MANVWLRLYEITGAHVSGASPYGPRCTSSRLVVWARCDRDEVHWRRADSRGADRARLGAREDGGAGPRL